MSIKFFKGEEKYIQLLITSKKKEPIIITDATYTLTRNGEVVSGKCEIDDSTILILLNPSEVGSYMLEVTYTIPPETRKVRCVVDVS
jgi:hypothetical protein